MVQTNDIDLGLTEHPSLAYDVTKLNC